MADNQRRLTTARQRGWRLAEKRLYHRLVHEVADLTHQLEYGTRLPERPHRSSARDVLLDLIAVDEEFGGLEVDVERQQFSVTTDYIELEGIDLGRFEIVLLWREIGMASQPYRVVALDPCPSRSSGTVHPHLAGESLCEGEARASISAALASRRLLDFFVLVRQVLTTYNPESAYCELERWDGVTCVDCGYWANDDERSLCERCDSDLCPDCVVSCSACERWCCGECRDACAGCGDTLCMSCFATDNSDNDGDERWCEACLEEQTTQQPSQPTSSERSQHDQAKEETPEETRATVAAADALCVGQAQVLA